MKIFLNVVGAVALLAGPGALFLGSNALAQILGGITLLVAVCALGLAKLIELGQTHLERTSAQRLMERDFWKLQAENSAPPVLASAPAVPSVARFWVQVGEESKGPLEATGVQELRKKGLITDETYVLREGEKEWKALSAYFPG